MRYSISDIVMPRNCSIFGTPKDVPARIHKYQQYKIAEVIRTFYGWDNLIFAGINGEFYEYDFVKINQIEDGASNGN